MFVKHFQNFKYTLQEGWVELEQNPERFHYGLLDEVLGERQNLPDLARLLADFFWEVLLPETTVLANDLRVQTPRDPFELARQRLLKLTFVLWAYSTELVEPVSIDEFDYYEEVAAFELEQRFRLLTGLGIRQIPSQQIFSTVALLVEEIELNYGYHQEHATARRSRYLQRAALVWPNYHRFEVQSGLFSACNGWLAQKFQTHLERQNLHYTGPDFSEYGTCNDGNFLFCVETPTEDRILITDSGRQLFETVDPADTARRLWTTDNYQHLDRYFGDGTFNPHSIGFDYVGWLGFTLAHEQGHIEQERRAPDLRQPSFLFLNHLFGNELIVFHRQMFAPVPGFDTFMTFLHHRFIQPYRRISESTASFFALDSLAFCLAQGQAT